jgi:hypothetical protein
MGVVGWVVVMVVGAVVVVSGDILVVWVVPVVVVAAVVVSVPVEPSAVSNPFKPKDSLKPGGGVPNWREGKGIVLMFLNQIFSFFYIGTKTESAVTTPSPSKAIGGGIRWQWAANIA